MINATDPDIILKYLGANPPEFHEEKLKGCHETTQIVIHNRTVCMRPAKVLVNLAKHLRKCQCSMAKSQCEEHGSFLRWGNKAV
jgi:hypothetical protein